MKSMMSGCDRRLFARYFPHRCSLYFLTGCILLLFFLREEIQEQLSNYRYRIHQQNRSHQIGQEKSHRKRGEQSSTGHHQNHYTSPYPDEEAVKFLKENTFFPDPTTPYNLDNPGKTDFSQYGDNMRVIKELFKNRSTPGYFLEIGAWDGEELSNTLYLERSLKWTGLLIEANKDKFKSLKFKNRKATIVNACVDNVKGILEVAKVKEINYLSLDIEGNEPKFMAAFPWDEVPVDVVEIECCYKMQGRLTGGEEFFDTFMDAVGFRFIRKTRGDRIYVRKSGKIH